jgi:hypothetical protein
VKSFAEIEKLIKTVREKYSGCKNRMRFEEYKCKIYSRTGTNARKQLAVREIALIMEVKP